MREIFKWINLLVDELEKDGLQIPEKKFLGKPIQFMGKIYLLARAA